MKSLATLSSSGVKFAIAFGFNRCSFEGILSLAQSLPLLEQNITNLILTTSKNQTYKSDYSKRINNTLSNFNRKYCNHGSKFKKLIKMMVYLLPQQRSMHLFIVQILYSINRI